MGDAEIKQNVPQFICDFCDVICFKQSDWNRHLSTTKHKKHTNTDGNTDCPTPTSDTKNATNYICYCGKEYKHRQSLFNHKKICQNQKDELNTEQCIEIVQKDEEPLLSKEQPKVSELSLIFEMLKQNNDFKELIITQVNQNQTQNNQMMEKLMEIVQATQASITNNNNINNGQIQNNNNTQFNLQVYLNQTCKNAMTINDFLDYLQPTIEELEATAHLGYVESISRIIMRGFKNLEEEELPFHCTDLKREHIYVKNPDKEWVKETDDKPLLLRFVKEVSKRNFNNIFAWQKQNPTWSSYSSKKNDLYNSIVENAMSGATEKEQNDNYEKIMKNIMKNTTIDRSKKNKR
jgi:hypothetical protein